MRPFHCQSSQGTVVCCPVGVKDEMLYCVRAEGVVPHKVMFLISSSCDSDNDTHFVFMSKKTCNGLCSEIMLENF